MALKTKYSTTFDKITHHANNVQRVHNLAETQVKTYTNLEENKEGGNQKKVVAFAITFVVSRPYVTECDLTH